jgi:hypothetical protein
MRKTRCVHCCKFRTDIQLGGKHGCKIRTYIQRGGKKYKKGRHNLPSAFERQHPKQYV